MPIVALVVLACTALTGLVIFSSWLAHAEVRRARSRRGKHRRLPPALVYGHAGFALTAAGVWLGFVLTPRPGTAWTGLALLVLSAILGITMFLRWVPTYRGIGAGPGFGPGAAHRMPPGRNLPLAAVLAHGLFAVATLVLAVLAALGTR